MKSGVSTACLYPLNTEDSLAALLKLGFKTVEVFLNSFCELEQSFLQNLRDMADANGAKIVSVHPFLSCFEPFMIFSHYMRRFEDGCDLYRDFIRAANILNAGILVMHGDYTGGPLPLKEYLRRFEIIHDLCAGKGVLLTQENVYNFKSNSPEFILKMKDSLKEKANFTFDVKQAVRSGFSPFDMLSAMSGSVRHIHVNDNIPGRDCLLPGKGSLDFAKLKKAADDIGYKGEWIIEVYRQNFEEEAEILAAAERLDQYIV